MHIGAILFGLTMMLLSIAALVFWVWTLVDCVTSKRLSDTQKIIWALVIFFVGIIGSLVYVCAGRTQAPRVYAPAQPQYYYSPQPYQQPTEQAVKDDYRSYQEGYQAQSAPSSAMSDGAAINHEEQSSPTQVQHEHIQISYPE